jgi:hypothetical protein
MDVFRTVGVLFGTGLHDVNLPAVQFLLTHTGCVSEVTPKSRGVYVTQKSNLAVHIADRVLHIFFISKCNESAALRTLNYASLSDDLQQCGLSQNLAPPWESNKNTHPDIDYLAKLLKPSCQLRFCRRPRQAADEDLRRVEKHFGRHSRRPRFQPLGQARLVFPLFLSCMLALLLSFQLPAL